MDKNNYQHLSQIMQSFHDYDDDEIGSHIADLNSRIEVVENANKITEQKRNSRDYYNVQRIKKQHKDLESEYYSYDKNSQDQKFNMMSLIDKIQKDLSTMEESDNE